MRSASRRSSMTVAPWNDNSQQVPNRPAGRIRSLKGIIAPEEGQGNRLSSGFPAMQSVREGVPSLADALGEHVAVWTLLRLARRRHQLLAGGGTAAVEDELLFVAGASDADGDGVLAGEVAAQ